MGRILRVAAAAAIVMAVAACDKCGNININVPGAAKACSGQSAQT
jgi:hypothetical protein